MIFDESRLEEFRARYPEQPARLSHGLAAHPLLQLEKLAAMAGEWPADRIEYNTGELTVNQNPDETPANGLTPAETVRRIAECKSWLVLKNIERDPAYGALLKECLSNLTAPVRARTGAMHKCEAFIFISSPGAVTPFHMDPEHNILMQVRGAKAMRLWPAHGLGIVSQEQHEAFHTEGGHRNLTHCGAIDRLAAKYVMEPGDALYVPVKAPHWVQNGSEVSISLSITWRSRVSDREARLHSTNAWLRGRGANPPPPGAAPMRDYAKAFAHKVAARFI